MRTLSEVGSVGLRSGRLAPIILACREGAGGEGGGVSDGEVLCVCLADVFYLALSTTYLHSRRL